MTTPDGIHSCSYFCHFPACIKAQRDELRDRALGDRDMALIASSLQGAMTWAYHQADHAAQGRSILYRPSDAGALLQEAKEIEALLSRLPPPPIIAIEPEVKK